MTDPQAQTKPAKQPTLADRLRDVHLGTRQDLEVSRHLFQDRPSYVIRDPLTFESYRLDAKGYAIFVALERDVPLGAIFSRLVERGCLTKADEEAFYQTILSLHRLNFLNLPISDDKLLYQRHLAKQRARFKEKAMGFLFLRIPLVNPDAFLNHTIRYARFLFTQWFFAVWLLVIAAALIIAVRRFDDLIQPMQGILVPANLPIMWVALIALKVLHELGHAYACKRLGGHVPEMGVYLILFTPLAYVDATSSWGFSRKRDRLIVGFGGMYFEGFVAALALFVWASSSPGLVRDLAYNLVFLAGVATVLFNINPLMRYDGYYILGDLVEIPNLRQQATQYVTNTLKRVFLGLPNGQQTVGIGTRVFLFVFGVAASLYRISIVLAISIGIASKFLLIGMGIAVLYVANVLITTVHKLAKYLWFSKEAAPVRVRAVAVSILLLIGLPILIATVPVRSPVLVSGVLRAEREEVVRARVDGAIQQIDAPADRQVTPKSVLVRLDNDAYQEGYADATAKLEAAEIRAGAYMVQDPVRSFQENERAHAYRQELSQRRADLDDLVVRAGIAGQVLECVGVRDLGRYVKKGQEIARIGQGAWQIRAMLTQEEVADCRPAVGQIVEVRAAAMPGVRLDGRISRIVPKATTHIDSPSLTQVGGGAIAVDPRTQQAAQPYFEVVIDLAQAQNPWLTHGMTCRIWLRAQAETIAAILHRRLTRLTHGLLRDYQS
ncbi:MAG: HlyD family efflux transporter periplasmic adaptor subunit [Phycisphaerae bacterium]|nr:HlyD family efflux transporter periplasmic adaptor subunit [Phycisphaerae bacterium]